MADELLLTQGERKKYNDPWKSNAISQWIDEWDIEGLLKAQLAKVLKHRLDRPELREKIANHFFRATNGMISFKATNREDISLEFADQILALLDKYSK